MDMNNENEIPNLRSTVPRRGVRSFQTILRNNSAIQPPVYAMLKRIGARNSAIGSTASSPSLSSFERLMNKMNRIRLIKPKNPKIILQGIRRISHQAMTFLHDCGSEGVENSHLTKFLIIFLSWHNRCL